MTAASNAIASSWKHAIGLRQNTLVQRLGLATAAAIVLSPLLGWSYCVGWILVYFALQGFDYVLLQPFAADTDRPVPAWRATAGSLSLAANAAFYGALVLPLWLKAGLVGGIGAIMMLSAAALHNTLNASRSGRMLVLTVFPHLLWLMATPAFMIRLGALPNLVTATVAALAVFSYCCFSIWQHLNRLAVAADRAEQEIADQDARFRQLLESRDDFVATVCHDLRTPLSAILSGAAQLDAPSMSKTGRDHAHMINDAGFLMKKLLDDLLDHAKIEAGHMDVAASDFDLRTLLASTLRLWQGPVKAKGLRLRLEGAFRVPRMVRTDPIRLRQILNNLISNALKFTDSGSITVHVTTWEDQPGRQALTIEIRDTGVGMSSAQKARLFRPFDQTADGISARYGGTGLGLSISRQLAELMGGHLTVRSAPGQGSSFTLSLIVDLSADDAVATALPAEPQQLRQAPQEPGATMANPDPDLASDEDEGEQAPAMRVLVVDDHEINRRALQLILTPLGCEVAMAVDGKDALGRCDSDRFDIIFMDVRMPELDGRETTRRLRAGGSVNAAVPVIAVTADSSPEDVDRCMAAGMSHFVAKPITPAALIDAVNVVLAGEPQAEAAA